MNAVPRLWPGQTVVCLASGPSLTVEDCEFVRGKARVIAINRTIERAPWADVLYCADAKMWSWLDGAPQFEGLKYCLEPSFGTFKVADHGVQTLKVDTKSALSLDPTRLAYGKNSGYQAVNLAVLLGATRIVLLGYDMQVGPGGERHWHAEHPQTGRDTYREWRRVFAALVPAVQAAGVELVNATRVTALECVPRRSLADALMASERAA